MLDSIEVNAREEIKALRRRMRTMEHRVGITERNTVEVQAIGGDVDSVVALPPAPAMHSFAIVSGPPDTLYVSMQQTGGTWVWVPLVMAP